LWGFFLSNAKQQQPAGDVAKLYQLLRSKSNSRFCVLRLSDDQAAPDGFQDVVAVHCENDGKNRTAVLERQGRIVFTICVVPDAMEAATLRKCFFTSLIDGANGVLFEGKASALSQSSVREVLAEAQVAGTMLRLGRFVEWTQADRNEFTSQHLDVWARRYRDEFLMAVRHDGDAVGEFKIPAPVPSGKLSVLGEARQVAVQAGMVQDKLESGQVRVYSSRLAPR
jgi:hypothetical protein